ncbi:MAG: cation:proton antiporter domain-containing protein [Thalassotalea sp.]
MEFIWILFAFVCGFIAKTATLPPSIGFLLAGFILNFLGYTPNAGLDVLADLGITLMLFTIGLKLNVKDLLKNEVWLSTSLHTVLWLVAGIGIFKLFSMLAISYFAELNFTASAIIIFALSFSSTVCIVKLLEENGEMKTRHGKLAIGILVMQDIIAVAFLVVATGKTPSVWAFLLLGLFFIKPLIFRLINHIGHGELLPLAGFVLALGGYELFNLVQIKGDLGALIIGMFLASHPKATEITKSLLSFKDIFLIGFFLSIGFVALPNLEMILVASFIVLICIPIKFIFFFGVFNALKLRCRTSYLGALMLSNFSEFGLIVAALSVKQGWLDNQWLVVLALAVSISFVLTSVVYKFSHRFFSRHKAFFKQFENEQKLPDDNIYIPQNTPVVIVGMGRVGMGAHRAMTVHSNEKVWGMDADKNKVEKLNEMGLDSYVADAEDAYFWQDIKTDQIKLVLIALPSVQDIINVTKIIRSSNYQGKIAAIARYADEEVELEACGIDKVFNFYTEAGVGFADESIALINPQLTPQVMSQVSA